MLGRRGFLGGVGAAAAVVGAAPLLGGKAGALDLGSPLGLAGVGAGTSLGTCTVESVARGADGALSVWLTGADGRRFELELLAHDARTPGVARAGSLDVYVNNHGRGDTATDEEHGLAAMALGRHLAAFEAGGGALPVAPTLAARAVPGDRPRTSRPALV